VSRGGGIYETVAISLPELLKFELNIESCK
jgi:hypothetical protein